MPNFISVNNVADILGASFASVNSWLSKGTFPEHTDDRGQRGFYMEDLKDAMPPVKMMLESKWEEETQTEPLRPYTSVELFAGAGGLALGMHLSGFRHILLNELVEPACDTLRVNHPEWNVLQEDIHKVDFSPLENQVDLLTGGFPCQAFSFAGKKGGFNDTRGTLFFELARAVSEIKPRVFFCENVKGLLSHDNGRTLDTIKNTIAELGYTLVPPRVLKAVMFQVPQKRERLFLVAVRNDIAPFAQFHWPSPYHQVVTLRDAFLKGYFTTKMSRIRRGRNIPRKRDG